MGIEWLGFWLSEIAHLEHYCAIILTFCLYTYSNCEGLISTVRWTIISEGVISLRWTKEQALLIFALDLIRNAHRQWLLPYTICWVNTKFIRNSFHHGINLVKVKKGSIIHFISEGVIYVRWTKEQALLIFAGDLIKNVIHWEVKNILPKLLSQTMVATYSE